MTDAGDFEGRRRKRMQEIDALPPSSRELVHEWGWTIVKAFLDCGVQNPRHVRHLIQTVLNETGRSLSENGHARGSFQGTSQKNGRAP